MTKKDVVKAVAESTGFTQKDVLAVVDGVFETIASTVTNDEVSITGFGKFVTTERPERMMRNPSTGEQIKVAAKKSIKFRPAKALKDAINS